MRLTIALPWIVLALTSGLLGCPEFWDEIEGEPPSNVPPSTCVVAIAPAAPVAGDALVAGLVAEAWDPDGDAISYTYVWYRDEVLQGQYTGDQIPADTTGEGEHWTVAVRPSDGLHEAPPCQATAAIEAEAPVDQDGDGWDETEDCDDLDPLTYPGAPELCDGLDNDCDGVIPDDELDLDGDGFAPCEGDCDDTNPLTHPFAPEQCDGEDNDCDGEIDEGVDEDGDGDGLTPCEGDCDDTEVTVYPGAPELCDGLDNDCDFVVPADEVDLDGDGQMVCAGDCDDADPTVGLGFPELCDGIDNDCDGDVTGEETDSDGDGFAPCDGDCDDTNPAIYPGAAELCDGLDDDCDGALLPDEVDADLDGWMICAGDCDDTNGDIYPGAPELCNGLDDDCDGVVPADEVDADGDGFLACEDCDDADPLTYPGAPELCDTLDNDCDGVVPADEVDADGDGFMGCDGDCDDTNPETYPGAPEQCDELDNDCDGDIDEGVDDDLDGDGFSACDGDCDDAADTVYPGAPELCDGLDNDCDGVPGPGEDDLDGDGVPECLGDCDDNDPNVFPGAAEVCNYIDDNCDGVEDEDFLIGGKYATDEHCGYCGNDCGNLGIPNATATCDGSLPMPECVPSCLPGFFDVNGDPADGCECEYLGPVDEPFDGIDADCDGQDGDPADAIHVSPLGTPGGVGTVDDPLDTVQGGVDLSAATGIPYVLVAEGTYAESVEVAGGTTLVGGYSLDFEDHDPAVLVSLVDGAGATAQVPGTFTLRCQPGNTQRIQGFEILGTVADDPGESSYGIFLEDCDGDTSVSGNLIQARPGAVGGGGGDGTDGDLGLDGGNGMDVDWTDCVSPPVGGAGGAKACGNSPVNGGHGGGIGCPIFDMGWQPDGHPGLGPLPGTGGQGATNGVQYTADACDTCYINMNWGAGSDGTLGGQGGQGGGGDGCSFPDGLVTGGLFEGGRGVLGDDGEPGSGGGGGGTGSGSEYHCDPENVTGGTGGGGGSGGCGGDGGHGGHGGGGSFGVFLTYNSPPADYPQLVDNDVAADDGGNGGLGGHGGLGGEGGLGGHGGDTLWGMSFCGQIGGDGAAGGDGGHGGGGGGGCGGPSFGLYVWGASPLLDFGDGNQWSHGAGGDGGTGGYGPGGYDGGDGADGTGADRNF